MRGRELQEYHVFLASPGDVGPEREFVRRYFDNVNRTVGVSWRVRFQVVDWENFATAGLGRPQELITRQTLERFRPSLALVVVIMAQRFGSPTGVADSGTEEEIRWALATNAEDGFPEIKFFFRQAANFVAPADPDEIAAALDQYRRVVAFRRELEATRTALYATHPGPAEFADRFAADLDRWLHADERPWARRRHEAAPAPADNGPPTAYFESLLRSYQWLDIAGIDSDRAFKLPLDQVYVRLRVIPGDDVEGADAAADGAFGIQTALARYRRLVVVGDPGSGKSTFLRFVALTLAQSTLAGDAQPATDKLSLGEPLPMPLFLSCWDLSEQLQKLDRANLTAVTEFIGDRLREAGWPVRRPELEQRLADGDCIVLVDGLDEVPTDEGRHLVTQLIEELVGRYPQNRYVVTSRIRAYTGATVLGQQFARCDIQPFSAEERSEFLRNWVGQLFGVRGGDAGGRDALAELDALSEAIETSSIRSLAVNPLLLTVIAIVHWNRKRLPEQRVDLYDECVDVLLGQRKQAEQQRAARDTRVLDEAYREERLDQRVWVRKRFAEIAYAILSRSDEEIDQTAVIELLRPHFRDSGDETTATLKAERFLDRQELRSGLFVRRRAASYRFVHLTFQEYLAAWYLANRDLTAALADIEPHVREPKWFETLQLLGGQLANRSDEHLDQYVGWLLDRVGAGVREQAPVIALVANIVRDTHTVATLRTATCDRYEELLRDTLHAFTAESRVPKQTQLDLLEALGALGASVRHHLMSATGSRLLDVRRRALEMLVPHLSDDDLFSMTHLLADRSKEPVKVYLDALVARDRVRAGRLVLDLSLHGDKTLDALLEAACPQLPPDGLQHWPALLARLAATQQRASTWARTTWQCALDLLVRWSDDRAETRELLRRLVEAGSLDALHALVSMDRHKAETQAHIADLADDVLERLAGDASGVALDLTLELLPLGQAWALGERLLRTGSPGAVRALLALDRARLKAVFGGLDSAVLGRLAGSAEVKWPEFDWLFGSDDEPMEFTRRLIAAGSAAELLKLDAVSAIYRLEVDWTFLGGLTDAAVSRLMASGNNDLDAVLASIGTAEAEALLERLVVAGRPGSFGYYVQRMGTGPARELLPGLTDKALEAVLPHLLRETGWAREAWAAARRLAPAGSAVAVAALAERWGGRPKVALWLHGLSDHAIARLAATRSGAVTAVVEWATKHQAWPLVSRLAAAGSAPALAALINRHGGRESTWDLVRNLDHDALANLKTGKWGEWWGRIGPPWGNYHEQWQLLGRLAAIGSADAFLALVSRGSARSETWTVLDALDDASLAALAETVDSSRWLRRVTAERHGDQLWGLVARFASAGSVAALGRLLERQGDRDQTWARIAALTDDAVRRLAAVDRSESLTPLTGVHRSPESGRLAERLARLAPGPSPLAAWWRWTAATAGRGAGTGS